MFAILYSDIFFLLCTDFPSSSCKALYDHGYTTSSGKYNINPGTGVITVFCDMSLQSGGWTVIQRRVNGSVDFDESWKNYQIGFGNFDGNFWLGLEKIKAITDCETNELYIGLESLDTTPLYRKAEYSFITLKDEANFYELDIGTYSGNAGDSFATHDGVKFSTHDKDNDNSASDCSGTYNSGWWYKDCHSAHLNGIYYATAAAQPDGHGIIWEGWLGTNTPLKTVVIAVRPA